MLTLIFVYKQTNINRQTGKHKQHENKRNRGRKIQNKVGAFSALPWDSLTCSWKKAQIVYEDQNGGVADDDDDDDVDDDDDDDDGGGAYQQILSCHFPLYMSVLCQNLLTKYKQLCWSHIISLPRNRAQILCYHET